MSLVDQQWCPTSVQVTALQARGLRVKGKSGTNDAYAVIQVGKEKYQTSVVEKSVSPVWKEEATFELPHLLQGSAAAAVGGGGGGGERSTLRVHVLHRALVGPDKLLGQAVINLPQLSEDKTRPKTEWFKLLDKTGKPDKDRGEVLLDIQFMRNSMTASMFDLSAAGKSRSRLGKFKDKVRGKKKESDSASSVVPSFSQVMTDSEDEANGDHDGAASKDGKSKKHKIKSLFSSKSNLQRNMSQSMSILPAKNSSLSGSQSSGLNVDSSEGKKKFKFMIHKRSGSSDSKESWAGHQKQVPVEQSNLCINGSHVYCEEPPPRTSRIGSNFSLASSGHGSMEDVPESSPPSVDSLRAVRQYSPWMEEDEEEEDNKGETIREDVDKSRGEDERNRREEEGETIRRQQEELKLLAEEKNRREEEEKAKKMEEERIRKEEEKREEDRVRREEEQRLAEEKERLEEQRARFEEEKMRRREEEERIREEERQRQEECILAEERRLKEEERKIEEENLRREEQQRREEERRRKEAEEELLKREAERIRQREEEERLKKEEARKREEEERARKEKEEERLKEKLRQEEEWRIEAEKIRKEEEERRRMEEELLRKEEEKRATIQKEFEEKRELEEQEKMRVEQENREREHKRKEEELQRLEKEKHEEEKRIEAERVKREEKERLKKDEDEKRKNDERMRRQEMESLRLKVKRDEEERIMKEEEIRQEEERRKEQKREEQEMIKKEEEEEMRKEKRRREEAEEKVRKEKEVQERLMEETRRLEEQEKRRTEEKERVRKLEEKREAEEERMKREEQERIRREEERRQKEEQMARKEDEENERLVEMGRLKEQEKRRIEEEEKIRREERGEDQGRKQESKPGRRTEENEEENKENYEQRTAVKKSRVSSPADVPSTNPFDETFSPNPSEEVLISSCESDRRTAEVESVKQRCQAVVSSEGSGAISCDEKDVISSQREKRLAPQPPRWSRAQRQTEQDASTQHLTQIYKQSKDKDVKTASVHPQRTVQITPSKPPMDEEDTQSQTQNVTTKETVKHTKRPAPSRPCSIGEQPLSESKTSDKISHRGVAEAEQVHTVYGLNPFEDDDDDDDDDKELTALNDASVSGPVQWPPAKSQTADEVKVKSMKMARAPPPPAKTDATPCANNKGGEGVTAPKKVHEVLMHVDIHDDPNQGSQQIKVQNITVAAVKEEGPPPSARRLQPVKPLNPLTQSTSVVQEENDNKSTGILVGTQDKTKVYATGIMEPYSQLTKEELICLVLKQDSQLLERDRKIAELEQYIDNLLVRVIEEQPSILMSLGSIKKAA